MDDIPGAYLFIFLSVAISSHINLFNIYKYVIDSLTDGLPLQHSETIVADANR